MYFWHSMKPLVSGAFSMQLFPEISATYAVWLYYKPLSTPIKRLVARPTNIIPQPPRNIYTEMIILANVTDQSLKETGDANEAIPLVAAVITPPVLQLTRSKQSRTASLSTERKQEKKLKKSKLSPSSRKSQTPDRRNWGRGKFLSRARGTARSSSNCSRKGPQRTNIPRCFL